MSPRSPATASPPAAAAERVSGFVRQFPSTSQTRREATDCEGARHLPGTGPVTTVTVSGFPIWGRAICGLAPPTCIGTGGGCTEACLWRRDLLGRFPPPEGSRLFRSHGGRQEG